MSGWSDSVSRLLRSKERLQGFRDNNLSFGVSFLDMAIGGINTNDLVLIGAPSGVGKTGFVTNLALTNIRQGKKVHLIALEAYEGEIEDRIKYRMLTDYYFNDKERKPCNNLSFRSWVMGECGDVLDKYEDQVIDDFQYLENLHTYYRSKNFNIQDFIKQTLTIRNETDLILIDHIHYFDIEDENENRGLKQIVKKVREVQALIKKPVVMVAHLRKGSRVNQEVVAGADEFHGSSDLVKIATKVITMAKGQMITPSRCETFFRIPKNRLDGSVTFYVAKLIFDFKKNTYDNNVLIGQLVKNGQKFEVLPQGGEPLWIKNAPKAQQ